MLKGTYVFLVPLLPLEHCVLIFLELSAPISVDGLEGLNIVRLLAID